jgi:hypothetical protein
VDVWQAKRQIAWLLGRATWADSPSHVVLVDSIVSEDEPGNFQPGTFLPDGPQPDALPFSVVQRGRAQQDRESSVGRLAVLELLVQVVAGGAGVTGNAGTTTPSTFDSHGRNQVTGALRGVSGAGDSSGRDVDEVASRLIEAALGDGQLVDSIHGLQGEVSGDLALSAEDGVQVLTNPLSILLYNVARARFYHHAFRFKGTNAGGGVVNLTWVDAPARFDTFGDVVRRGTNPSDPAPTSPTGGVAVTVTGTGAAQATGLVTSRTYNFSHFKAYDETGSGSAQRYSDPITCAVNT